MKHFFLRLSLYFSILILLYIHPAVTVSFDRNAVVQWFLIFPALMFSAYFIYGKKFHLKWKLGLPLIVSLIPFFFLFGWTEAGGSFLLLSLLVYALTYGLFHLKSRIISVIEPFISPLILLRLLQFSRSNPLIMAQSEMINRFVIVLIFLFFLFHLYLLSRIVQPSERLQKKEKVFLPLLFLAFSLLLIVIFSPDVVQNDKIENLLGEKIEPELLSGSDSDNQGEGGEGDSDLYGVDGGSWGSQRQQGNKQYAVMIVASAYQPLYAAGTYYGKMDPDRGFVQTPDFPLNELLNRRLIETWMDQAESYQNRGMVGASFYSIQSSRYVPYQPILIEPIIYSREFHPFDYTYSVVSSLPIVSMNRVKNSRSLSIGERLEFSEYLEINLNDQDRAVLNDYLDTIVGEDDTFSERIMDIMDSFTTFRYELGQDEDVSISKLIRFIMETKEGDCSEFSNTAALLGRMAGIPSRVVTGFLVSKGLQSSGHRKGIEALKESMPALQQYSSDQLYLVTTNHSHSWVEFFLPDYGWVNFEATDYAIPPESNPNEMDVVIPVLRSLNFENHDFQIPWRILGLISMSLIVFFIVFLYTHYWSKRIYLKIKSGQNIPEAYRYLMRLTLIEAASMGARVKKINETPLEYAKDYPEFEPMAVLYNSLRFKTRMNIAQRMAETDKMRRLRPEVVKSLNQKGLKAYLRRCFSIKGGML